MTVMYTNLPTDFIDLLKLDMNTRGSGFKKLKSTYWHEGSISSLVKKCFFDIDSTGRFERIIHSLGWLGFRDRIAAAYIEYQLTGHFPNVPDLNYIEDVIKLEEQLKPYTIDGFGRGFLLGFYIKMSLCETIRKDPTKKLLPININKEVLNLLDLGQSKLLQIDWLCLTLLQVKNYKRISYLTENLKSGVNFRDLITDLPDKEREQIIYNLVTYGASIKDREIFFDEVV
jgi:hypothetical protein